MGALSFSEDADEDADDPLAEDATALRIKVGLQGIFSSTAKNKYLMKYKYNCKKYLLSESVLDPSSSAFSLKAFCFSLKAFCFSCLSLSWSYNIIIITKSIT